MPEYPPENAADSMPWTARHSPLQYLERLLYSLGIGATTLFIATSLITYLLFHYRILTADGWDFYQRFLNNPFWASIWKPRYGHRLFLPGLLDKTNLLFFHGDLTNLVAIGICALLASAWFLARDASLGFQQRRAQWLMLAILMALILWLGNRRVIAWAFGLTYILSIFGVVAACHCLFRGSQSAQGRLRARRLWYCGAVLGALIASLSSANGLASWPILLLLAWPLGVARTTRLSILAIGAVVIGVYFIGYQTQTSLEPIIAILFPALSHTTDTTFQGLQVTSSTSIPSLLFLMASRTTTFLGNTPGSIVAYPAVGIPSSLIWTAPPSVLWIARMAGVFSLIALGGLVWLWWRHRPRRQWLLPLIGTGLFVVVTAIVIGMTRGLQTPPEKIVTRYRIFSTLLWAALLAGYIGIVMSRIRLSRQSFSLGYVALVLVLLLLPGQAKEFIHTGERRIAAEKGTLALATGSMDMGLMFQVFALTEDKIQDVAPHLMHKRLSIFQHPWTHWRDKRLPHAGISENVIAGGITEIWHFQGNDWSTVKGWLADTHRGRLIVGVDATGRIRGMAMPLLPLPDDKANKASPLPFWLETLRGWNKKLPVILGWGRGWYGYVEGDYKPHSLRYYLVTRDKQIIGTLHP